MTDIPPGDILCHLGDVQLRGSRGRCCCGDVRSFVRFMKRQKHPHKLIVAGNHDRDMQALGKDGMRELTHSDDTTRGGDASATATSLLTAPGGSGNASTLRTVSLPCMSVHKCPIHSVQCVVRLNPSALLIQQFHRACGIWSTMPSPSLG